MTSIAANRREMAFDSRESDEDGHYWRTSPKVLQIGLALVGCSGDSNQICKFLDWFTDQKQERPELDDMHALALDRDGLWYYVDSTYRSLIKEGFFAIGTGGKFAMGAMAKGASPREAVKTALRFDSNSGPPVLVLRLPRRKR